MAETDMAEIGKQDAMLRDLFAADLPPARDPVFVLSVLRRVEKRQLRIQAGWLATYAVAAGASLYALQPVIGLLGEAGNIVLLSALSLALLWSVRRDIPGIRALFPT